MSCQFGAQVARAGLDGVAEGIELAREFRPVTLLGR
jgi:hypothetical protein